MMEKNKEKMEWNLSPYEWQGRHYQKSSAWSGSHDIDAFLSSVISNVTPFPFEYHVFGSSTNSHLSFILSQNQTK